MEQYCLYLRKSRADQEAERRGEDVLESHEKHLMALANKKKHNITKIFREVVSGESIDNRPEVQDMLNQVEDGVWTGVYVMEVERLARGNTRDQGVIADTFKYSGTKIITPVKTYDPDNEFDEEYFEFGLYMSRREYKTINRRQQRGRIDSVKQGNFLGSIPPYGYEKVRLKNGHYSLEPIQDQADVVKMIFQLYTSREDGTRIGTGLIARKLNDLHIPTQRNKQWIVSTINGILRNPVYMGKIRWNGRPEKKERKNGIVTKSRPRAKEEDWILVDGHHEALVTEESWQLAQQYLALNPAKPVRSDKTIQNPLVGIIRCDICGRTMVRRPYAGDYPDTLMCQFPQCSNVSSFLYLVEEKIIEGLKIWLSNYKSRWSDTRPNQLDDTNDVIRFKQRAVEVLEKELNELLEQSNEIDTLLERKLYSVEKYIERTGKLNERMNQVKTGLELAKKELELEHQRKQAKIDIIPKLEHVIEVYSETDGADHKNDLLKSVLDYATYRKDKGGRWHGEIDGFQLTLHPKLPK